MKTISFKRYISYSLEELGLELVKSTADLWEFLNFLWIIMISLCAYKISEATSTNYYSLASLVKQPILFEILHPGKYFS